MRVPLRIVAAGLAVTAASVVAAYLAAGEAAQKPHVPPPPPSAEFAARVGAIPYRIVYETWRGDNWELFSVKADGSDPVNLTNSPRSSELYPHVSPDGAKICFVADEFDEGAKEPRIRTAWLMNIDGSARTRIGDGIREACWSPDGRRIAYLKCEFDRFTYEDYATKGVAFYDLDGARHADHPNKDLYHLYNLCWSADGNWFVATVHGGMGYKHAILAFEARGTRVFDLKLPGCRPDLSPDGKRIAWGPSDWQLDVADIDFSSAAPKVTGRRTLVKSAEPVKIYHIDWSPDGRHVTFSRGPERKTLKFAPEMIGIKAAGWNLCVADAAAENAWCEITADGNSNKEPDWVPLRPAAR
ncbi:MAG: hypothetical protein FJ288_10435 [Planctomycetes bacterium]|nr:hypothetical protein [Planctomycetota bacterium]